jgi:PadR family transcriptional regulator PadR
VKRCQASWRRFTFFVPAPSKPARGLLTAQLYIARFTRMTPLARITPATVDVLRVLLDDSSSVWGMLVIKRTGRPAGSVYPILERLEGAGWVSSSWEADTERSGPRRRLYELTGDGAEAASAEVQRFEAAAHPASSAHPAHPRARAVRTNATGALA